jgi:hypothetical protein
MKTTKTTKTTKTNTPDAWTALVLKTMGAAELLKESRNTANSAAERRLMTAELSRRTPVKTAKDSGPLGILAPVAAKKATSHKPRVKSAAPSCSRCGRQNSHGADCRNADACKSRRREAAAAARA